MSRFITKQGNKYIEEIESMEVCKMKYNGVCCNDKCPDLGDYPYPSRKCEGSCAYAECVYILTPENEYCDKVINLSL